MDFIFQYGLFLAKAVTWVAAILLVAAGVVNLVRNMREHGGDHLEVKNINDRFRDLADALKHQLLTAHEWKQELKQQKAADKAKAKAHKKANKKSDAPERSRVFVLDFHGDLHASQVGSLREEISAVLQVARPGDETLLRLESEGGVVHGYGLAASQLKRVREHGLKLTVAVDKVAASGGYLMACVADKIVAAPFAIVGSIGVVAQLPNFSRLLKKHEVDYELHTAGEFKRTLTVFGENTEAGRAKFQEELEDAHDLFKSFIAENRPQLPLAPVATGEHWFGSRALALKLVDELKTSDDYLLARSKDCDLFGVSYKRHRGLVERVTGGLAKLRATFPW